MKAFSSVGKNKVRQSDRALISDLHRKAGRKLTYLGLPSPWMGDISVWRPYLSQVFAIERERRYLTHLMDKAYTLGLINQVVYLWGEIDEILNQSTDKYGRSLKGIFPIDLVNLDYCKGLDYRGFRKLSTIESLIDKQKEGLLSNCPSTFPYFLILLTHNLPLREGNPTAKKEYIEFMTRESPNYERSLQKQINTTREWYLSKDCPSAYPHKCFVIGRLSRYAHKNGFKARPKEIIQYYGDKQAVMLHYQFQLTPVSLNSPVPVQNMMSMIENLNWV